MQRQSLASIQTNSAYLYAAFAHGMQYQRLHIVLNECELVVKALLVSERLGIFDRPELVRQVTVSFMAGYRGSLSL